MPIYTSSPGDSSIGMNIAYHELMNGSRLMIDPNRDVNEVCAIVLAGKQNGCVILGGGSPKNFYLQAQPTLWEVYGIPKGGNDYFIQITTDQVVWGGLSGATPAEAVSWGKVNPGVLPDTVVAYCDSTIAFPLFCEYALGSPNARRPRKELLHKRDQLVAALASKRRQPGPRAAEATREAEAKEVASGNARLGARAARRADLAAAPHLRRRQCAGRPGRAFMRQALEWDVLFVMEARRSASGIRRGALPARAAAAPHADHHRPRLPRRSAFSPGGGQRRAGDQRAGRAAVHGADDRASIACCSMRTSRTVLHCHSRDANCSCTPTGAGTHQ